VQTHRDEDFKNPSIDDIRGSETKRDALRTLADYRGDPEKVTALLRRMLVAMEADARRAAALRLAMRR